MNKKILIAFALIFLVAGFLIGAYQTKSTATADPYDEVPMYNYGYGPMYGYGMNNYTYYGGYGMGMGMGGMGMGMMGMMPMYGYGMNGPMYGYDMNNYTYYGGYGMGMGMGMGMMGPMYGYGMYNSSYYGNYGNYGLCPGCGYGYGMYGAYPNYYNNYTSPPDPNMNMTAAISNSQAVVLSDNSESTSENQVLQSGSSPFTVAALGAFFLALTPVSWKILHRKSK